MKEIVMASSDDLARTSEVCHLMIVDDHEIVRTGLIAAFDAEPGIEVVGSAESGTKALEEVERVKPDIAIVDYRLPDIGGPELCRRLRALEPELKIIVLSTYLSEDVVHSVLGAGADAFVSKAAGVSELKKEVRAFASGTERTESAQRTVARMQRIVNDSLGGEAATPQQVSVVRLAALGLTNREIGAKLFITESTVRFHLQSLKTRLGARNKVELVARAIQLGFLADETAADDVIGGDQVR